MVEKKTADDEFEEISYNDFVHIDGESWFNLQPSDGENKAIYRFFANFLKSGEELNVRVSYYSTIKPKYCYVDLNYDSFSSYSMISDVPSHMFSGSEETISLSYPTDEWKSIDSIRICNGWDSDEYIEVKNNGDDTFTFEVPENYDSIRIRLGEEHDSFAPYTVTVGNESLTITDRGGGQNGLWHPGWRLYADNGVATMQIDGTVEGSIRSEGLLMIRAYNGDQGIVEGEAGKPAIDVAGDLCIEGNGSLTVRAAEGQGAIRVGKRLEVFIGLTAEGGDGADAVSYGTSAYFLGERDVNIQSDGEAEALAGNRAWLVIAEYPGAKIAEDTGNSFVITAPRFTFTFEDTDGTVLDTVEGLLYDETVALSDYPFEKAGGSEILVGWKYEGDDDVIPCTTEVVISDNTTCIAQWADPGSGVVAFYEYGNHTEESTSYYDVIPAGEALPAIRYVVEWNSSTQKYEPVPRDILMWTSDSRMDRNGLLTGACYFPGATVPDGGFDVNRLL